jgi:hypothetical protein
LITPRAAPGAAPPVETGPRVSKKTCFFAARLHHTETIHFSGLRGETHEEHLHHADRSAFFCFLLCASKLDG